jgi:hypothetical protein
MITIDHTIKEPSSLGFLYSPTDECIGEIENELQLYDVQIQICKQNVDGYYIKWKDERLDITNDGQVTKWPVNYCDQTLGAFAELHHARMAKRGQKSPIQIDEDRCWRHSEETKNEND